MQPLDVTCFKSFKQAFRAYRDKWTVEHKGQKPVKEDLTQWVSCGLRRALSIENIVNGFSTTGFYPINARAMDSKMGLSEAYDRTAADENHDNNEDNGFAFENTGDLDEWVLQEIFEENVDDLPSCTHYYVNIDGDGDEQLNKEVRSDVTMQNAEDNAREQTSQGEELNAHTDAAEMQEEGTSSLQNPQRKQSRFNQFLQLPKVLLPTKAKKTSEPLIDY